MSFVLPYSSLRSIHIGPIDIQVWGFFVAVAVLVTTAVAARRARRFGLSSVAVWDAAFWIVLAGVAGARALYVAEYWRDFIAEPWRAIAVWEGGMSAFGSILAGVPAAWLTARRRGLPFGCLAAAVAPTLLLGDTIGRLGGAASHMYAGTPTAFPLSYVLDGVQRHEVGVELALASLLGFLVISVLERRALLPAPWLVLLWYSAERFLLDFLRAADLPISDLRYAGLTLAQYAALIGLAAVTGNVVRSLFRSSAILKRSPDETGCHLHHADVRVLRDGEEVLCTAQHRLHGERRVARYRVGAGDD